MKMKEIKTENETEMNEYDWKCHIREVFTDMPNTEGRLNFFSPCAKTEVFLTSIWKMSTDVLKGKEIQVLIDNRSDLYISSGSASFLSFTGHEDEFEGNKIQLPIRCWIHTRPSGEANVSATDWKIVRSWQPIMKSVIVLGDNQYLTLNMDNDNDRLEAHTFQAKKVYYGLLTEDVKSVMDVDVYVDELEE